MGRVTGSRVASGTAGRHALLRVGATLTAVLLLGACGGQQPEGPPVAQVSVQEDGYHGAALEDPYVASDVTLTDTHGRRYSLVADSSEPLTLVFFGYTSCPDVCSVVMADVASAMTRLEPADRRKVGMLFVTSDPARDDPATLRRYLDRFDPSFEGLTGDLDAITKAAGSLGVPIERGEKLPSGGYEVGHGAQVVAMRDDGRAPLVWTAGTSAEQMATDIARLLREGGR